MQQFEIFKPGKQTSSNGVGVDFGEAMLRAAAAAYDPAVHEAPIVVGHPKDNHPAFGWIKSLSFADGSLHAMPDQVDPEFSELVSAGRYKKRSASFYLPDSPTNPKPGTLYLRHVGFLGAQPPAVKGLKDVAFSEGEEGIVEFYETSPYIWTTIASAFRGLREWLIADKGLETADKMIPNYMISELEGESKRASDAMNASITAANPSFTETQHEDNTMLTPEQIKALQDENAALKAKEAQSADFAEKERDIVAREAALLKTEIGGKVDALVTAGKVLPAHKSQLVDFMASLQDSDMVVEFGEGDKVEKFSQRGFFEKFLSEMPKAVDFKEHSKDDGIDREFDVKKAEQKIAEQVATGGKTSA